MQFVIDHVDEFNHVHDADGNALIEALAGATIVEDGFAIGAISAFFIISIFLHW
jgi:hypothetical protein